MAQTFQELKKKFVSGESFASTQQLIRFDFSVHKETRLRIAGVSDSGSLLHNAVSKRHADRLAKELFGKARKIGTDANRRFRLVTLLQALVDPTIECVSEAVDAIETKFKAIFGEMGLWSRGSVELEMVNLSVLERISESTANETRKLNVLNSMFPRENYMGLMVSGSKDVVRVLVHCHVVVDFGSEPEKMEEEIRKRIERYGYWQKPYQKEILGFHKNKPVEANLRYIAKYVTKGGNENLRYNAKFGRDSVEDLEAKICKAGGLGLKKNGGETFEDERSLSVWDVKRLDELYLWLMGRRKDKRGYLIWTAGR